MRLLADENFPKPMIDLPRADGGDVSWSRTDCPGLEDPDFRATIACGSRFCGERPA
jgi:hypothetical protein